MGNASVRSAQSLRWLVVFSMAVGFALLPYGAQAINLTGVVTKVEEDWELVLNEPSPDNAAPQVTCVISPVNHADGIYAALELNHGTLPDFSPGGLQLQVWSGEEWLTVRDYANTTLQNTGEVVTWTRQMKIQGGKLTFQTYNGNSTSWGAFGGSGNIKLSLNTTLTSLNLYDPELSKAQSGIGFGSQRVQSLVLKRVRYYDALGVLMTEDNTPRVVHQQ